jgi:diaminopimelate decarboxylase
MCHNADLTSQFEWDNFVENFKTLIVEQEMGDVTLNFECGRFIVAHIGYYDSNWLVKSA